MASVPKRITLSLEDKEMAPGALKMKKQVSYLGNGQHERLLSVSLN